MSGIGYISEYDYWRSGGSNPREDRGEESPNDDWEVESPDDDYWEEDE